MSQTLEQFVAEVKTAIDDFEKQYIEKSKSLHEYYPLELEDDNAGLWVEFFSEFLRGNDV